MKNPFAMPTPRGSRGLPGPRGLAGSKMLRRFYKAKHGKRGSYAEAAEWYRNYDPAKS